MNKIESRVLIAVISTLGSVTTIVINDINKNIQDLNLKVATMIERTISHERRIESIERKIFK